MLPFPLDSGRLDLLPAPTPLGRRQPFVVDRRYAEYVERKLALLETHTDHVRVFEPGRTRADDEAVGSVLHHALQLAQRRRLPPLGDALRARIDRWLARREKLARLADRLALTVMEDFAVIRLAPAAAEPADRIELLHVAFPNQWDPRAKAGRGFASLLPALAGSRAQAGLARELARGMLADAPTLRFAWSIAFDGELEANLALRAARRAAPPAPPASPEEAAARAWLRVERQVTHPFPGLGRALFTIRTFLTPLAAAVRDPDRRLALAAALEELAPAEVSARSLAGWREPLVRWLRA